MVHVDDAGTATLALSYLVTIRSEIRSPCQCTRLNFSSQRFASKVFRSTSSTLLRFCVIDFLSFFDTILWHIPRINLGQIITGDLAWTAQISPCTDQIVTRLCRQTRFHPSAVSFLWCTTASFGVKLKRSNTVSAMSLQDHCAGKLEWYLDGGSTKIRLAATPEPEVLEPDAHFSWDGWYQAPGTGNLSLVLYDVEDEIKRLRWFKLTDRVQGIQLCVIEESPQTEYSRDESPNWKKTSTKGDWSGQGVYWPMTKPGALCTRKTFW